MARNKGIKSCAKTSNIISFCSGCVRKSHKDKNYWTQFQNEAASILFQGYLVIKNSVDVKGDPTLRNWA